jgi:hypothetical protein
MTRLTEARARSLRMAWCFLPMLLVMAGVSCLAQTSSAPRVETPNAGAKAADVESALFLICKAGDITRSKAGQVTGCRVCPEGTGDQGQGYSDSYWKMKVTSGHFTSAQGENLILGGTADSMCEDHAHNFGGSYFFSLDSGKVRLVRYHVGLITDQCHKFAYPDGRDFLVCRGGWNGQGLNSGNVFMASFAPDGKETVEFLLTANDTTGTAICLDDKKALVQESQITSLRFAPDSGHISGLTISATLGQVSCSQAEKYMDAGKPTTEIETYSIKFQFDGQHFKPTPASLPAFHKFERN